MHRDRAYPCAPTCLSCAAREGVPLARGGGSVSIWSDPDVCLHVPQKYVRRGPRATWEGGVEAIKTNSRSGAIHILHHKHHTTPFATIWLKRRRGGISSKAPSALPLAGWQAADDKHRTIIPRPVTIREARGQSADWGWYTGSAVGDRTT